MNRLLFLTIPFLALSAFALAAAPQEAGDTPLAKAVEYMARRAIEGHLVFDTEEIEKATGVDVEALDEEVLQKAVLERIAELRAELPEVGPATQDGLATLDSFDLFVETFNRYKDVPRIVLLLSPT